MGTVPDADKQPEVWHPDTRSFVTFKNINFMGQISKILIIVSTFLEIVIKLITVLHWSRVREGGDWGALASETGVSTQKNVMRHRISHSYRYSYKYSCRVFSVYRGLL